MLSSSSHRVFRRIGLGATSLWVALLIATGILSVLAPPVSAAECGDAQTSIISCDAAEAGTEEAKDSSNNPIISVLTFVMQILTGAVGIAAVGALIYAGILYSAAGGESAQVQKAKTLIKDTVIGIVCYAGMILILNFIIPGGVFGQSGTVGSGTTASSGGSSGDSTKGTTTVTAASWNTLFSNKTTISKGTKSIAKNAQIIGLQEVHWTDSTHRNSIINDLICSSCAYDGYMDPETRKDSGSKPASLPIAWSRARFTRVDAGYKKVYLEKEWPGGGGGSSKWITWVKLKDKETEQQFYVINTHTVANVESGGKPEPGVRMSAYKQHIDILTSLISSFQKQKLPILLLGDFNVNYRYDSKVKDTDFPYYRLGKLGVRSSWDLLGLSGIPSSASTHGSGSRLIDYVWLWGSDVKASNASIGAKYGSDHYAVYTTVTMGTAKATTSSTSTTSLTGVQNFRDAAASSTVLKTGILYRSMRLSNASSSDAKKLSSILNGGTIIDLRETSERSADPDVKIAGVSNISIPATGTTNYAKYFVMNKADRNAFKKALETIANAPGNILVHCTYGKDRTGWTVAMVMYASGATDSQVMKEFLKSNDDLPSGKYVKEAWLKDGLAKARKQYGSITGYLKDGLGLSDATLAKLNNKMRR